jgi:hypothetical protein
MSTGTARDLGASEIRQRDPSLRDRLLDWSPEIALVVATTAGGLWAAGRWVDPVGDPGIWWSAFYRLANGEKLYRDVYLQFGPLSPYLLSFGARLFGASASYFLIASWLPAIGASLLLLRAARPALSLLERFAVAGLLISESLFVPGPGRLVFAYAPASVQALLFSVAAFLLSTGSARASKFYLAGSLAGLAFCSKQEIGLACLAAILASALVRRRGLGQSARSLAAFSAVSVLGAVFVFSSAPVDVLRDRSHLWPLAFVPPEPWNHLYRWVAGVSILRWEVLVLRWAWLGLACVALSAVFGLLMGREKKPIRWVPAAAVIAVLLFSWPREGIPRSEGFHPVALSAGVAVLSAGLAFLSPGLAGRASMLALSVFAGLIGARAAFGTERFGPYSGIAHFSTAFTWVLFLCVLVPKFLLRGERAAAWTRRAWAAALLIVAGVDAVAGLESLKERSKEIVRTPGGRIAVSASLAPFFRAIGSNVRRGESIWVLPEINGVDALFHARNISPYPSHLPGWLDEEAEVELIHFVERHPPDVVVIFDRSVKEYGVADFGEGYDRLLSEWVERNYSVVEAMPAGRILRSAAPAPSHSIIAPR